MFILSPSTNGTFPRPGHQLTPAQRAGPADPEKTTVAHRGYCTSCPGRVSLCLPHGTFPRAGRRLDGGEHHSIRSACVRATGFGDRRSCIAPTVPFPAFPNRLSNLISTDRLSAFVHLNRSHIERGTRCLSWTDDILTAISAADDNLSLFTRLVQQIRQLLPCFGVGVHFHIGSTAGDLVNALRLFLSISILRRARVDR